MADEDEVDVEGDFDMDIGMEGEVLQNLYIDMNEPPSKSANLLPEYTQHPWMLEQGWSLDHCTDERSKAAIEKMLQEEQQYINGKKAITKVTTAAYAASGLRKQAQQKRVSWTEEERQIFQKGLELHGRSWSRISEMIPDKTTQQVKSYGQHYFKIKAREDRTKTEEKKFLKTHLPIGIQHAIQAVTTAQPTVKVSPKKLSTYYDNASTVWIHSQTTHLKTPVSNLAQTQNINIKPGPKRTSPLKGKQGPGRPAKGKQDIKYTKDKKDSSGTNTYIKQKINSLVANSEVVHILSNCDIDSEESDVDIDIDIESDDNTKNLTKDDVYHRLVESAGIDSVSQLGISAPEENTAIIKGSSVVSDYPLASQPNLNPKEPSSSVMNSEAKAEMEAAVNADGKSVESEINSDDQEQTLLQISSKDMPSETAAAGTLLDDELSPDCEPDATYLVSLSFHNEERGETNHDRNGEKKLSESEQNPDCDNSSLPEDIDAHQNEFGIQTSNGDIVYLQNPVSEITLPKDKTTEEEKRIHSEFFSQRSGIKTPDRYLRIRNFILKAWEKCRPRYLNKTSVRPGLKDCGDVNSIGRIHAYLEQVGAINFNCSQAQYLRCNLSVPVRPKPSKNTEKPTRIELPTRKRRVRDYQGQWVDEKELEGKTTQHNDIEKQEKKQKVVRVRTSYDPFKLIPCLSFTDSQPAPYKLVVESSAMVTMDTHSHMSKTEVIGLLGGEYSAEEDRLLVTTAVPCDSISTGMQCEMDPVSQLVASQTIEQTGRRVVGWYHSHPTFTPDPSCRDIETQQKFQEWFGEGGNPFIGVIVSPYCQGQTDQRSLTRCLVVLNTSDERGAIGQPYQFEYTLSQDHLDIEGYHQQVELLANKYVTYPNCVHLLQRFSSLSSLSCLDKMLKSLGCWFPESMSDIQKELCLRVSDTITVIYQKHKDKGYQDLIKEEQIENQEVSEEKTD